MSVYKRGRIYWTKFRVNGVLYRISLETSSWHESLRREKDKISLASAGKLRSDRGEFANLPFDQALEQHLVEVAPYQAVGTRKTQSWHSRPLAAFFGRTLVRKIDEESLRQYVAQRVLAGRANGTINQETHVLRGVLKRARRWGLVGDEFRQLPETSRPGRVMTHDEKVRFLKVAASNARWERAYCAAVLAFNTSMRSAEIKGLRWRQVDWMNETLTVRRETTKTDKGERLIPLNQEAKNALGKLRTEAMARFGRIELDWFVFFRAPVREEPDPTRPSTTWAGAWCSILKAAGLGPLRFHDTRHQFVTELAESGNVSPETIMQIAGHGSRKMIEHYSHIRLSAKRAATDLLRRTAPEKTDSTDCKPVRRESEGRDTGRAQSRAQLESLPESCASSPGANKGDSHFHRGN